MAKLGLKETVEALRRELSETILVAEGKQIRFEMGEIELEFQVMIEQTSEGKAGINFWVVELGGELAETNTAVHRIKIPLKPVWRDGSPVLTGSQGEIPG